MCVKSSSWRWHRLTRRVYYHILIPLQTRKEAQPSKVPLTEVSASSLLVFVEKQYMYKNNGHKQIFETVYTPLWSVYKLMLQSWENEAVLSPSTDILSLQIACLENLLTHLWKNTLIDFTYKHSNNSKCHIYTVHVNMNRTSMAFEYLIFIIYKGFTESIS